MADPKRIEEYLKRHRKGDWNTFEPMLLSDYVAYARNLKEPEWLLENLVMPDSAILMSGPPTIGFKSWMAFQMGMCIATGRGTSLLKPGGPPSNVWILEQEGPMKSTLGRFDLLEKASNIEIEPLGTSFHFSHREHFVLTQEECVSKIAEYVAKNNIKFLVIDTLAKSVEGDENSAEDIGKAMRAVDRIRDANRCTVMYLHHIRKRGKDTATSDDVDEEIRGSSALAGAYDIHLALRRSSDLKNNLLNFHVRSNEFEPRKYEVFWNIDKRAGTAHLNMTEVALDGVGPVEAMHYLQVLEPAADYSVGELSKVWNLTFSRAREVAVGLAGMDHMHENRGKWRVEL